MSSAPFLIFHVDDMQSYKQIIKTFVKAKRKNYQLVSFVNGESLLKNVYHEPDIVVLDRTILSADDIEFLSKFRKLFPDIPIVVISDFSNGMDLKRFTEKFNDLEAFDKTPLGVEEAVNYVKEMEKSLRGSMFSLPKLW